jgi:hypothetical protein
MLQDTWYNVDDIIISSSSSTRSNSSSSSSSSSLPIPVAVQSKAWVCGGSLSGILGSNPRGGIDVCW